jgi:hypothetical protein
MQTTQIQQNMRPSLRQIPFYWIMLFMVPTFIGISLFVLDSFVHVFFNIQHIYGWFWYYVFFFFLYCCAIFYFPKKRLAVGASIVLALVILYPINVNFFSLLTPKFDPVFEVVKISIFSKRYQNCIASAQDVGQGKALGLCEIHSYDFPNPWGSITEAIVYDSSGQIMLPHKDVDLEHHLVPVYPSVQSTEWQQVANKLLPGTQPSSDSDYSAWPIPMHEHFYHVQW